MMSVVYMLQCGVDGPIKIGTTHGMVVTRIQGLQGGSPEELRWIGAFIGGREEERAAHEELAAYRKRGEWFYPTAAVRDFIARRCGLDFSPDQFLDCVCRRRDLNFIRDRLRQPRRDIYRLADLVGVRDQAVREWKLHLSPPSEADVGKLLAGLERLDEIPTEAVLLAQRRARFGRPQIVASNDEQGTAA